MRPSSRSINFACFAAGHAKKAYEMARPEPHAARYDIIH